MDYDGSHLGIDSIKGRGATPSEQSEGIEKLKLDSADVRLSAINIVNLGRSSLRQKSIWSNSGNVNMVKSIA